MALADLRTSTQRMVSAQDRLSDLRAELSELEAERADIEKDKARGDEFRAVIADIRLKQSEIDLAEEELEGTRRVFQTANDKARGFPDLAGQLETMGEQDLIELEADFINHAEHRSEERRGGKEGGRTFRTRGSPDN